MFAQREKISTHKPDALMSVTGADSIWLAAGGIEVCYR